MTFPAKQNISLILLFCFVCTLAGGSLMFSMQFGPFQLYAYRFTLIAGLIYIAWSQRLTQFTSRIERLTFYCLVLWIAYGVIALSWCPELNSGIKEVSYLVTGTVAFMVLSSLHKTLPNFQRSFITIWTSVFLSVAVFSINEILTKHHLLSTFTHAIEKLGVAHASQSTPVFAFDNPNHFAIYLCLTLVLSIYSLFLRYRMLIHVVSIALCLIFIYLTESRLALLVVLSLAGLIFCYLLLQLRARIYRKSVICLILASCVLTSFVAVIVLKNGIHLRPRGEALITEVLNDPTSVHQPARNHVRLYIDPQLKKDLANGKPLTTAFAQLEGKPAAVRELMNTFAFPLCVGLLAFGFLIFQYRKKKLDRMLLMFCGGLILLSTGLYITNPFFRPGQRWTNFAVVEVNNGKTAGAGSYSVESASFSYDVAQKYFKKRPVTVEFSRNHESAVISDLKRKQLFMEGIRLLKQSHYLGVGPAGYEASGSSFDESVREVPNPHNLFVEVLSQYGVIVTILLFTLLAFPCYQIATAAWRGNLTVEHLLLFSLIICLAIMSNSNSSSLPLPIIWVNFTLIILQSGAVTKTESSND